MRRRKFKCEICEDAKHVYEPAKKSWVKCVCFKEEEAARDYERAGVGQRFANESWQSLIRTYQVKRAKDLIRAMVSIKRGEVPYQWFMIVGRPSRARDLIATLVLRTAVDGGVKAASTDLATLVQAEFGRAEDEDPRERVAKAQVVVLYAGGEPKHSYNKHAIERVIRRAYAKQQLLILIAEDLPGNLQRFYKSGIVQEALGSKFLRVQVEPKEEE